MQPMPVITARSRMNRVPYHALPRYSTWLAALALASSCIVPSSAQQTRAQPDRFAQLFERASARRESLRSIRARFTETTVSTLLEKPIVGRGTILATPPARVLMTYTEPERKTVSLDSKLLLVVWPDRNEREKIDIAQTQKRIDEYFTQASLDQLRSMFDVTASPDAAMRETEYVDMRPKRKQIKAGLERLELWIDRENLLPVQMRMSFPGGDAKTIKLDDIAINVPVTNESFQIKP
jgi:outer membrane lipoprotein-sorting protein